MGTGDEEHRASPEVGSGAGESPRTEGAQPTPRDRLIRALMLGVGALALGISVIFSAGSYYYGEVGMPLFHFGAAVCWLGRIWGRRSPGVDLIVIGVLYFVAGWFWYLVTYASEQYPPAPYWPCYVVMGMGGVSLVVGVATVALRRRANVRAGTQMSAAEIRHKAGTWLVGGGLLAMCVGLLDTRFMGLGSPGLICGVIGGALLGKRVLGMTLMGVGVLCAFYVLALTLRFSSELGYSTSLVVVLWSCVALAFVGSVAGAVMLLRSRSERESAGVEPYDQG